MRYLFFAGKGGVGKTTCATAAAIAEAARGRRVLLASTDPAHSVGDVLRERVGPAPRRIPLGRGRSMTAVEIDGPRAFARWLGRRRAALGQAIEHGTWLDRDDIDALLDLSLPGVDELIALVEIVRLAGASPTDVVVVDTAPTGHALRLIDAPTAVAAVARVLDALQAHHRAVREQFGRGAAREEAADRVVAEIAADAERIGALVRDPDRTSFAWVLLPESLALEESKDALRTLRRWRIPVHRVIVNRVLGGGPRCPVCDARRRSERRVIEAIRRATSGLPVEIVWEAPLEPRGIRLLAAVGRELETPRPSRLVAGSAANVAHAFRKTPRSRPRPAPQLIDMIGGARLVLFGGKGGVGKTTVAAAAAVAFARAQPRRRVLLLSTDPAHSVGDVLERKVGDRTSRLTNGPPNLRVRELDARASLASRRGGLEGAIAEIADAFGAQGDAVSPSTILDLAPPGIDELFALLTLVEATVDPSDLVIVDTAPTGHTLRLLAMPEVAAKWVQTLLRMLLKYREVARPGRFAAELVELSRSIRGLSALLHDGAACVFVPVARAAEAPRLETERLLASIRDAGLAVPAVVVNALTPAFGRCPRCRRAARAERIVLASLRRSCRRLNGCDIIQTPLVEPPPRGVAALERWAASWIM